MARGMSIQEEFTLILEEEKVDDMYTFLERLNEDERKDLRKTIREKYEYYYERVATESGAWGGTQGSERQKQIISAAGFVCLELKDFQELWFDRLDKESLEKIGTFYLPKWLNEYIESRTQRGWVPAFRMDYGWMMDWAKKGWIQPSRNLICFILPTFLYEKISSTHPTVYERNNQKLLQYPETLQKHIWFFF